MKLGFSCAWAFVVALGLLGSGCTEGGRASSHGPVALVGEAPGEGAVVFLRNRPTPFEPHRTIVEVVARGAGYVHGAALRVAWDPAALAFVRAERGEQWSKAGVALAKEGSPGQLAVLWSEKGERAIDASQEVVLGIVVFESVGRADAAISFEKAHSMLVDKKGAPVKVSWSGGTVMAQ